MNYLSTLLAAAVYFWYHITLKLFKFLRGFSPLQSFCDSREYYEAKIRSKSKLFLVFQFGLETKKCSDQQFFRGRARVAKIQRLSEKHERASHCLKTSRKLRAIWAVKWDLLNDFSHSMKLGEDVWIFYPFSDLDGRWIYFFFDVS